MQSEFSNVALDRIRYALVWEDSSTLYRGLDIQPDDHVLVITSAGCNVLNALLKKPKSITAVDLNPLQNNLLLLKLHIIQHHDFEVFSSIMGFKGKKKVKEAWEAVKEKLPEEIRIFWGNFFKLNPKGILASGRLESYVTGFYPTLPSDTKKKIRALFAHDIVKDQFKYFIDELHHTAFTEAFIDYFDEANLSKGRDPRLFKHARDSGGLTFYKRFMSFVGKYAIKENFFMRFFFFGAEGIPENILPPCYQKVNYASLKEQASKVSIMNGEAIDFLLSAEGRKINKASLSNIFEYTSTEEFNEVCKSLFHGAKRSLKLVFWNLLKEQGNELPDSMAAFAKLHQIHSERDGCFYFQNVKKLESINVSIPELIP